MIRTIFVERMAPFRRWLPSDIYFWLKAILLALIAIQLAGLAWAVIAPVGPLGRWQPAPARLLPAPVQATLFATVNPFSRSAGAAESGPIAVDLQLFGIRGGQGSVAAAAIIGPPDGEQKSYVVGEEVAPGIRLAAVGFDHVILSRGTARQTLSMHAVEGAAAGAGQVPAGTGVAPPVTASTAAQAFSLNPRTQGGRVTGITVAPGANAGLFAAAGFRPGDIIVAVNGARISSSEDVQQFRSSIAPGARLMLSVERGAETIPVALNIPGNP